MGKVTQKDRALKASKQKRRIRGTHNKYLKPGALAQLRNSKALAAKSCTDLGKKRIEVLDAEEREVDVAFQDKGCPAVLSPERFGHGPLVGPIDSVKQNNLQRTPQTPRLNGCLSESRLECLPMDLLVKILCHMHHDQLRPVFHVSQKIRKAVVIARQFHFNYTTPDRPRQEMLRTMTPLPTEHWPFMSKADGKSVLIPSPNTPKAPKHGPRPPSRIKLTEMRQIAAVLFQESSPFPSRCIVPTVLAKPLCKSFDELCQAVAQNKLH